MQNGKHVVSLIILTTLLRLCLVKVDCVTDVIKLNRWQILAGVTGVKTSWFGQVCNELWVLQFNEESFPKENNRPRL